MKHWRAPAILILVQLGILLLLRADFLTDWDSYLYTYGALRFEPVGLAGGRWFFTAILGLVWRTVNLLGSVNPDSAWRIFSWVTISVALLNAGLFYRLALRWLERGPAIVAAAMFISSPLIGLYGSAVMTETYAIAFLLGACLLLSSPAISWSRAVTAGVLFGLGCAFREPLILLAPLPVGLVLWCGMGKKNTVLTCGASQEKTPPGAAELHSSPAVRWFQSAAFLLIVPGVFLLNYYFSQSTAADWTEWSQRWSMGMSRERLQMVGWLPKMLLGNFIYLVGWLILFSPFVVVTFPEQLRWIRTHRAVWIWPLVLAVAIYSLGQVLNHSLVFNPRFAIFPGLLLVLPAAAGLWAKIPAKFQYPWPIAAAIMLIQFSAVALTGTVLEGYYFAKSRAAKEVYESLSLSPDNALLVPGRLTPAVELYRKVHLRPWQLIYGGWDFSDKELMQEVERSRDTGRAVFLVEPEYWAEKRFRPGQYQALENVWNGYPHRPGPIRHFVRLDLPVRQTPQEFFRRLLNYLFSS